MTDKSYLNDADMDELFALAADDTPAPSVALTAKIIADAERIADQREAESVRLPVRVPRRKFSDLLRALGGWPALSGLATATVVGVWIGFAPPEFVSDIADSYLMTESGFGVEDFMPSYEGLFDEG